MLGIAGSKQVVQLAAAAELVGLAGAVVLLVDLAVPVDIVVAAAPAEAGQEHVVDLLNKEVVRNG
jgi:hypothetical protein